MASMEVPRRLTLDNLPISANAARNGTALLGMEVAIGERIKDVIESIKKSSVTHVSLGKKPVFITDNKESGEHGVDEGELTLVGRLALQEAAAKPKQTGSEALDLNDPALLSLQQSLAEHAQRKQANTTVFVEDSSQLPPAKSGRQAVKAAKVAKSKSNNPNLLKPHRQGLFDQRGNSRSTVTSPSLSGMTPRPSKPSREPTKQDALKRPLLHLLAVRPVSESFVSKTLNCSASDIKGLLEKYGRPNRLTPDKYELSDRGYKDLDVWKFPYRNQDERAAAVENAISAFDRQRISTSENVWQMLLPKEKRGKGINPSKLKLHTDTPTIPRARTPKIQVSSSGDPKASKPRPQTEEKPGRLSPNVAATGGASSSPAFTKPSKLSEQEPQAKKHLPNNTKKPTSTTLAKPAPASPTMAPKKKAAPPTNGKVKSAEFVHDSDDSEDLPDLDDAPPKPAAKPPTSSAKKPDVKSKSTNAEKPSDTPKPTPAKKTVDSTPVPSRKVNGSDAAPKSQPMARQVSHHRKSSSPLKPSPLGSSPPTNASDMDVDHPERSSKSSSSSNSPLMNQRASFIKKPLPASSSGKSSAAADRVDKPLKRKASELVVSRGMVEDNRDRIKRRQSTDVSSSDSSRGITQADIQSSQRFKEMHERYAALLRELKKHPNPPFERVERLKRMYAKLTEHKASLWKLAAV